MMNVKISQNNDNVHHITKNYALKFIYGDENECINATLLRVLTSCPNLVTYI